MKIISPKIVEIDFLIQYEIHFNEQLKQEIRLAIKKYFYYFMNMGNNFYLSDFQSKYRGPSIEVLEPINFICNLYEILEVGFVNFK